MRVTARRLEWGRLEMDWLSGMRRADSQALDEGESFLELGEQGFFRFEGGGVDAAAEATHFYWMLEVEHLVVEKVLDCIART